MAVEGAEGACLENKPQRSLEVAAAKCGQTLTVLTCLSLQNQIDEEDYSDDEDNLIEQWTPRFRR